MDTARGARAVFDGRDGSVSQPAHVVEECLVFRR
jgi:hypothetical protein